MMNVRMNSDQLREALTGAVIERPGAWNQLFGGLHAFAESQVRLHLGFQPWQEQKETIQTVLEYLWKDRKWIMRYQPSEDPVPYVLEVMRHSVYRCMRDSMAAKRRNVVLADDPELPLEPDLSDGGPAAGEVRKLEHREALEWVAKWLNTLPVKDRRLFTLRWHDEEPTSVVATLLGMNEDAVNQRFRRLNAALNKFLADHGVTLLLALMVWSLPWLMVWRWL